MKKILFILFAFAMLSSVGATNVVADIGSSVIQTETDDLSLNVIELQVNDVVVASEFILLDSFNLSILEDSPRDCTYIDKQLSVDFDTYKKNTKATFLINLLIKKEGRKSILISKYKPPLSR
tara:strand:- start:42 stop:407 length:366 start_codon:yes stop_codon:yes gene_type:complete